MKSRPQVSGPSPERALNVLSVVAEACFRDLARTSRLGSSQPRFSGLERINAKES
jgi:hypothetical protein